MQSIGPFMILPGRSRNLLCLAMLLALGACSWAPPQPASSANTVVTSPLTRSVQTPGRSESGSSFREQVVRSAMAMMGTPYRYGGATPSGFDCSGLVVYSYKKAGVSVPRTSGEQYHKAQPVPVNAARPGDLVFFGTDRIVSHVGIYLGEDEFIHAPEAGQNVKISSIRDDWYRAHFAGIGRIAQDR
jgi:cell wall-associated NlpC family hydrolase